MKLGHRFFVIYCSLIAFSIAGSVASVLLKLDPGPIAPLASFCLILSGAACLAIELRSWRPIALVLLVGTVAELVGLYSGYPFGNYLYTDKWWPTIPLTEGYQFPFLLPFAWLLIVGGCHFSATRFTSGFRATLLTAALATLIDAPMERAMTDVFGYWQWHPPGPIFGAPILNSIGWFFVSLVAASLLPKTGSPQASRRAPWVISLFCLFVAISGTLRFLDIAWLALLILSASFTITARHISKENA